MKRKRYLFLLLGLALLLTSLVVSCTEDKPYYSADEVAAIVRTHLLQSEVGEYQVISASVSNVSYVGDRKWYGKCYIDTAGSSQLRYGTWIYYEKSGTLETNFGSINPHGKP